MTVEAPVKPTESTTVSRARRTMSKDLEGIGDLLAGLRAVTEQNAAILSELKASNANAPKAKTAAPAKEVFVPPTMEDLELASIGFETAVTAEDVREIFDTYKKIGWAPLCKMFVNGDTPEKLAWVVKPRAAAKK